MPDFKKLISKLKEYLLYFKELILKYKDDIVKPSAVLIAICVVISLALSVTNLITKGRIAALEQKNRDKTMSALISADSFEKNEYGDSKTNFTYYTAIKDGKTEGYVFSTSQNGYGGSVSVMTAIDNAGKIIDVAILDVSGETPGLGQNAVKESFYSQFKGKNGETSVKKNGANPENNEIDAMTGATITSKAVSGAVNEALAEFKLVAGYSLDNAIEMEVTSNEK